MKKLSVEETVQIKVLAVVSYEPQYKIAWLFNQRFGWSLAESEALSVINKERSVMQQFVVFSWNDVENGKTIYLIQNKGAQGILEPSMRMVDYWLRIENIDDMSSIALDIKKIEGIQLTQEVIPSDLKKNNLVFRNQLYQNE